MKFGLESFESAFPGNPLRKKEPFDDLLRDIRRELGRARVFCSLNSNIREHALIVSMAFPVRWEIQEGRPGSWNVDVYDLQHPVAEGWLMQEEAQPQFRRNPMTQDEKERFLASLSADDTAWVYHFNTTQHLVSATVRQYFGGHAPIHMPDADYLASILATALWNGYNSSAYIFSIDEVPDCPTVPIQQRRPSPALTQRVHAKRRAWMRR